MLTSAIILLSVLIVCIDLNAHRIPNILSISLFGFLLTDAHIKISLSTTAIALLICMIAYLFGFGMGDIKLFLVLAISQGALIATYEYLKIFLILTGLTVIAVISYRRTVQGSLAFAHVILAPFLWLYLDI